MTDKYGSLQEILGRAVEYIQSADFQGAKEQLQLAFAIDVNAPQIHNLLGIMFELKNDEAVAMRHYRAAANLDGTYRPALANLYRLGEFGRKKNNIDYGLDVLSLRQRMENQK